MGGYIPGLDSTSIAGSSVLKYGARLVPASLWNDSNNNPAASLLLSHTALPFGLLTHRVLELQPTFGITTDRVADVVKSSLLDGTHRVFGMLLPTPENEAFVRAVLELPTYSVDRYTTSTTAALEGEASSLVDNVASSVFNSQREFFRGAAKTLGDARLDRVYDGKLLRRVEVTQTGIL
eukprot:CAMPEP_0118724302 /NCGR_PEP_ID=MMETSP0800-20121206/32492_1 /TAXON_ID=210618 ORGANISM="Striatella unipunctata, Strain CCMP2910" /NCGR_SAMPLE_ID=MMETSP0800 /ASSEMBLY_ACC=CAM_ASM_000638 /LENGTH=178 /DNA_ID=CAMNT_0006632841 /DNA_START=152 /DNA_END=688 /DNA_ORIENTATION=-